MRPHRASRLAHGNGSAVRRPDEPLVEGQHRFASRRGELAWQVTVPYVQTVHRIRCVRGATDAESAEVP